MLDRILEMLLGRPELPVNAHRDIGKPSVMSSQRRCLLMIDVKGNLADS